MQLAGDMQTAESMMSACFQCLLLAATQHSAILLCCCCWTDAAAASAELDRRSLVGAHNNSMQGDACPPRSPST